MLNIYSYSDGRTIAIEDIKIGQKIRIEGLLNEVDEVLEGLNHREIAEGHEQGNNKRVYIEVLPTEIIVKEELTNKEFKEVFNRIVRYGDIEEIQATTTIWHDERNSIYGLIEYKYNDEYITISVIDSNNGFILDTMENLKELTKIVKKAYAKYRKWFSNYGIELSQCRELTV